MKPLGILFALIFPIGTALAQGPLVPPAGANPTIGPINALAGGLPQATMKTLHQVEPRTAIPGGTSTVTISARGAYYLTGNITVAGGDGIFITASSVTLDLNGFSIASSASPAAGTGIRLGPSLRNVTIRNGGIDRQGAGSFVAGVRYVLDGPPQPPSNTRISDLSVNATEYGIEIGFLITPSHIERCMVTGGSVRGISGLVISECVVNGGQVYGQIVKDCSVTTSGANGIIGEVVENCYATSTGTAILAKCLVNSYGTGGGDNDVISAGVAQNVWAEGGSGTGDGIEATVAGNSYGKRTNDLGGASSGQGIKGTVVHAAVGIAGVGSAVVADVVSSTKGENVGSSGLSFFRPSGIYSVGGVIAHSLGVSQAGDGIYSAQGLLLGVSGRTSGITGINSSESLISNSRGQAFSNGISSSGAVTDSYGQSQNGIGISGIFLNGAYGIGSAPTNGTIEFDSN